MAYSVKSLAKEWEVSTGLIYKLIKAKKIKTFPVGTLTRISDEERRRCEREDILNTGAGISPLDGGTGKKGERAQDNIGKIEDSVSPYAYAAMDADSAKLDDAAKAVALRLLSRAGLVDSDTLVAEYDSLSEWLPLESSAQLRTFLEKHAFIEPR